MNGFREISTDEMICSPFKLIGKDWLLICAADQSKESRANAMTASWGGVGILWNKPVATVYIRPQRHSFSLVERLDRISLCFPSSDMRETMKFCGTRSGADTDKFEELGIKVEWIDGVPVPDGSKTVMICKKAYTDDLKKHSFVDTDHLKHYPSDDFHRFYILEIEKILVKE